VLLGYVFNGAYLNFVIGVYLEKKTKFIPYVTGAGAIVNVSVNFALIPVVGMMGAAYAACISYFVIAAGMYVASQQFYRVRYEWGRVARIAVAAGCTYGVYSLLSLPPGEPASILLKLALVAGFGVAIVAIRGIEWNEIEATIETVKRKVFRGAKVD
jgi:O-antigen/teichoic acid export membrane protein